MPTPINILIKMTSYFYLQADKNESNATFLTNLEKYAEEYKTLIYVLNNPLIDQRYKYDYTEALIILAPKHKISLIDYGNNKIEFSEFVEDIVEDIGYISDKYQYKKIISRPRVWRNSLIEKHDNIDSIEDIKDFFNETLLTNPHEIKNLELLISLFIGSINDIDRVGSDVPEEILDKVKQKIQLFDGDQTRFVYQQPNKKRITIQGLSGTGKTELLLHKLKDLYTSDPESIIYFTCHNKILADNLRNRIPSFFNFMKVELQIEWEERLWCTNAWGSRLNKHSGAYRYICDFYNIPFYPYSANMSFSMACKMAFTEIKEKYKDKEIPYAFNYMFIDESQDFDDIFFNLCELVTEKNIYVAGDVFQSIFDDNISDSIKPDYLLGKCYRTDPKTLMFAHGLGMGLFEETKLRWLEEEEWKDCGYNVEIKDKIFHLSREPLRRFEDLADDFESISIVEFDTKSIKESVLKVISEIKEENPTILPHDIGIILLDSNKSIYELAETLAVEIPTKLGWSVNKAYETKETQNNAVLISNRNNVKGLEFPFVICITQSIKNSSSYRNSLYTMLTRSFIKSYLLLPDNNSSGFTKSMQDGLDMIISSQQMAVEEPTAEEKEKIRTRFETIRRTESHYDIMMYIFKTLNIDKKYHKKLIEATLNFDMIDSDYETLKSFIEDTAKYIMN